MARLIDADALVEMLNCHKKDCNPDHFDGHETFNEKIDAHDSYGEWQFANGFNLGVVASIIDTKNTPTIDAVEVVRCKDCKWYKESNHSELYPMRFCYRLKNDDGVPVGYNWADNDFCSYGERRDKKTASYYGDNKLIETVVIDEREKDEAD